MKNPPGHLPSFQSETKPFTAGVSQDFFAWMPTKGPAGGRLVMPAITVRITGTLDVATATYNGADVWRLIKQVVVEDRAGKARWQLSGYKSRIMSMVLLGAENHQEHPSIAVGAGGAVDLYATIPLCLERVHTGEDFALPADEFRKVTVTFASASEAATGTAELSNLSLNCYVEAHWYEEGDADGGSLVFHTPFIVSSQDFHNTTQCRIGAEGVIHDMLIVKESTTAGGDVITAITDVRIAELGIPLRTRKDLVYGYRLRHGLGASGPATPATERFLEPVLGGYALPVISATPQTSLHHGRFVEQCLLDISGGTSGLSVIMRQVIPRSETLMALTVAKHKLDPNQPVRVKTRSKSRRAPREWDARARAVFPVTLPYDPKRSS